MCVVRIQSNASAVELHYSSKQFFRPSIIGKVEKMAENGRKFEF